MVILIGLNNLYVMQKTILSIVLILALNNCYSQITDSSVVNSLPEISDYINDFEDVLSSNQENILKSSVKSFDNETNHKIIVVTVNSIESFENIYDYSLAVSNSIKFNSSVVIVMSKNLSQIQIQNNDSVIDKLTNEETKNILDNYIIPEFKRDNYFKGLLKGIAEIDQRIEENSLRRKWIRRRVGDRSRETWISEFERYASCIANLAR